MSQKMNFKTCLGGESVLPHECVIEHERSLAACTHTHLLTVAYALLLKAQFSLQVLDDGVLGPLDVRVGGDAGRLPGERFAGAKQRRSVNARVVPQHDNAALLQLRHSATCVISQQECHGERGSAGESEGLMKND